MILRISLKNFRSFRDQAELLLTPDKSPEHPDHFIRGEDRDDIGVLKSALIYGPNASGKSNMVEAVQVLRQLVVGGPGAKKSLPYIPFRLCPTANTAPTTLEIEFKTQNKTYAYGIIYTNEMIVEEWLFEISKTKEIPIFERVAQSFVFSPDLLRIKETKAFFSQIHLIVNEKTTFLRQLGDSDLWNKLPGLIDLKEAYNWFQSTLRVVYPDSPFIELGFRLEDSEEFRKNFHKILELFDTGIQKLRFETLKKDDSEYPLFLKKMIEQEEAEEFSFIAGTPTSPERFYVRKKKGDPEAKVYHMETIHSAEGIGDCSFYLKDESDGTLRLFDLIPVFMELMFGEKVLVIDEIERSLHPEITSQLFKLFHQLSKGKRSQLIASTHETELMDNELFRKDQFWFVQKQKNGNSILRPMSGFNVRNETNFRKNYFLGRFGALPYLKELQDASPAEIL